MVGFVKLNHPPTADIGATNMKIYEGTDETSIKATLEYLNVFHDGIIRRISFIKDVDYDKEGNVCHLCEGEQDEIFCNIEMELLLNSFEGASPKQIVALHFEDVQSFRFFQKKTFDYCDIYEVAFNKLSQNEFEFVFRIRPKQKLTDVLRIVCQKIICKVL